VNRRSLQSQPYVFGGGNGGGETRERYRPWKEGVDGGAGRVGQAKGGGGIYLEVKHMDPVRH